MSGVLD